jgi:hypothetical protein
MFARLIHQRLRSAVVGIGHDQVRGVYGLSCNAAVGERRRDEGRREAFAETGDCVPSAERELAQENRSVAKILAFLKDFLHLQADPSALLYAAEQGAGCRLVLFAQIIEHGRNRLAVACFRPRRSFDQLVRHSAHRGNDDDKIAFGGGGPDDLNDSFDAIGIAYRSPSKLHDAKGIRRLGANVLLPWGMLRQELGEGFRCVPSTNRQRNICASSSVQTEHTRGHAFC